MNNNINMNRLDNINNESYQKFLAQKSEEILDGKDSITVNELKDKPIFQAAFKNLNEEQKQTIFDKMTQIANFDNDAQINKEELNTILTLMDASYDNNQKAFALDGNFDINEKSAILQNDIKAEKMSRKEALVWVKDYMAQTVCSKKDAYKAFEKNFGYEVPKNIWGKIGNGFKAAFSFIFALGFVIASGNETINGNKK